MRERILEIVKGICPDVDFENETNLFDDGILESFDVIQILSELMDEYNVEIDADDIKPENLNSLDAICALVESRL